MCWYTKMNVYEWNGTNIFMRWEMKYSFAPMNGTCHLSPNGNICSITQMRKHSLFVLYNCTKKFKFLNKFKRKSIENDFSSSNRPFHTEIAENFGIFSAWTMAKRLLSLRVCVAKSIHSHDNATRMAQHNAQYAKLLARRGYSTVYYAQNNSRAFVNYACEVRFLSIWKCLYIL